MSKHGEFQCGDKLCIETSQTKSPEGTSSVFRVQSMLTQNVNIKFDNFFRLFSQVLQLNSSLHSLFHHFGILVKSVVSLILVSLIRLHMSL